MKNGLRILMFTILFVQFVILVGYGQVTNEISIKPDARIQAQISRTISIGIALEGEPFTSKKALSELSKLKKMESLEHLLQQLFYFQLDANRMFKRKEITEEDEGEAYWGANWIMGILLGMTRDENCPPITYASAESAINAVLPYMGTKDRYFKGDILSIILATVECVGAHESDYSKYELYIEKRKDNPPLPLIQYMYEDSNSYHEDSAGETLLSLMRVYMEESKEKELLALHEKIIRKNIKTSDYIEAIPSLNELSQHKEWWVRLYVAEILRQHPRIKSPEIVQRLKKDKHPLIQEAVKLIKEDKQ